MPNYKLTILVKDVADGDIRHLVDAIMAEHGEDLDAAKGDFTIEVAKGEGQGWYPFDLEEEED